MWFVIGVSGATCSGKSTLAHKLHQIFQGSVLVCQDDYFHPKDSELHVWIPALKHVNWEIPGSLDMPKMKSDVYNILGSDPDIFTDSPEKNSGDHASHIDKPSCPQILILEGFLVFSDQHFSSLCNLKYFVTLPKEECWKRRSVRTYDPPDVPGYFDQCVWPEYEKHRDYVFANVPNIISLDGTHERSQILQHVLQDIVGLCPSLQAVMDRSVAIDQGHNV